MSGLSEQFTKTFITDDRWKYLANGLKNTLIITVLAVLLGMLLGFLTAMIRASHDKTGRFKILNFLAQIYLTVIRGTPVVVQLLIAYFVIFTSPDISKMFVAVISFGLNSGAYVAEIVRGGIMAIDNGQFEAGAALGLGYFNTMRYIVMPQVFKNVLPSLANEFIVLLKETSVAGYIAIQDLTKGGDTIRSLTYQPLLPLLAVAAIYLVIVMFLTYLVSRLERRLAENDKR